MILRRFKTFAFRHNCSHFGFSTRKCELQSLHSPEPFCPQNEFAKLASKQVQTMKFTSLAPDIFQHLMYAIFIVTKIPKIVFKASHSLFKTYFNHFKQAIKNNFQYKAIIFLLFWSNIITIYDTHSREILFHLVACTIFFWWNLKKNNPVLLLQLFLDGLMLPVITYMSCYGNTACFLTRKNLVEDRAGITACMHPNIPTPREVKCTHVSPSFHNFNFPKSTGWWHPSKYNVIFQMLQYY